MKEYVAMSHHPETAEDDPHPPTHYGVQLQAPPAGGEVGALQDYRHSFSLAGGGELGVGRGREGGVRRWGRSRG